MIVTGYSTSTVLRLPCIIRFIHTSSLTFQSILQATLIRGSLVSGEAGLLHSGESRPARDSVVHTNQPLLDIESNKLLQKEQKIEQTVPNSSTFATLQKFAYPSASIPSNVDNLHIPQETVSGTFQENARNDLPPWLRTQVQPTTAPVIVSDGVNTPAFDSITHHRVGQSMSQASSLLNTATNLNTSSSGGLNTNTNINPRAKTAHIPSFISQSSSGIANPVDTSTGHPTLLPASYSSTGLNLTAAMDNQGGFNSNPGGQMFLPIMTQNNSLPMMAGGPLVPNSQPNSSFVRAGTGPMLNSAAQRAVFSGPSGGLLSGNMQQEYFQHYNAQQGTNYINYSI